MGLREDPRLNGTPVTRAPRHRSISRQLLSRVVLLGVSAIFGFSLVLYLSLRLAYQELEDRLSSAGAHAATQIDRTVGAVERDLLATSDALDSVLEVPTQVRQLFRRTLHRQPTIFRLALLDAEGNILAERRRVFAADEDPGPPEPLPEELGPGQVHAGAVEFETSASGPVPFLRLTVPLGEVGPPIFHVLQSQLDLSSLWSTVTSLTVGERGYVYIADAGSRLLVHQDLGRVQGGITLEEAIGRQVQELAEPGLHVYRGLEGHWVLGAGVPLQVLPWYAVIEEPLVDAIGPATVQALGLLGLVTLLAVLVLGILRFTQVRLVEPLTHLRSGVVRIGRGDLEHRIDIESRDEIGELAAEFNAMTQELQTTIGDLSHRIEELDFAQVALRDARDNLERGVEERTADLQAATQEMKALLYMVSHDLRAPLINLQGFAGELRAALGAIRPIVASLERYLDEERRLELHRFLEEDAQDALRFIEISVLRLNDFTLALLKLSRAGHQELAIEPLDLGQVMEHILGTLAFQIEQCGAKLAVDELPAVSADRMAMEQVLGNLVGNALNYRSPDRPPEIHLWAEDLEEEVRIHIKDNGRGIAEEDFDKIFAPFRRIGNVDSEGEGVGLAYAQTLVRRHGGRIRCRSTFGVGSEFIVSIPQGEAVERAP